MENKKYFKKSKFYGKQAQAIVEFAIALPILLALLIGILEVGRLVFIYSAVTNSSRNAVRFASAVGLSDSGFHKYNHCAGIKDIAVKSAYLIPVSNLTINISYDTGPGTTSFAVCDAVSGEDTDVVVDTENRVKVTVAAQYKPMINLIPIPARTITSSSSRTILGIINLDN
jgi:Flp pilus assembly protein TadG